MVLPRILYIFYDILRCAKYRSASASQILHYAALRQQSPKKGSSPHRAGNSGKEGSLWWVDSSEKAAAGRFGTSHRAVWHCLLVSCAARGPEEHG